MNNQPLSVVMYQCSLCLLFSLAVSMTFAAEPEIKLEYTAEGQVVISRDHQRMASPEEGLWSIATDWSDNQPTQWVHVQPEKKVETQGWTILTGQTTLGSATITFRDAYRAEQGMIKCIRRFEYHGKTDLEKITLSSRWVVPGQNQQAFLPGILYYGNPSGEKNTPENVPVYHGQSGEFAIFEEHRFPMPFVALEQQDGQGASALHSIPTPVPYGKNPDQWWSMGVKAFENHTELILMSGPIGYNGKHNIAKAIQKGWLPYPEATLTLSPGAVIEKTFYLDCGPIAGPGRCFQKPVEKSIELFQPFYANDFPEFESIVKEKYRFAQSRWIEGEHFAGFNMYPHEHRSRIVMGWCGQAASLGFALQKLIPILAENEREKEEILSMVQRSLDHLSGTVFNENGFAVIYRPDQNSWEGFNDYVSMGQAMHNFCHAILASRECKALDSSKWEAFLNKAAQVQARRILDANWHPRSTAEGFLIAPLAMASKIFEQEEYMQAAKKAADHYIQRHLSMKEPYWGGTLDANCEDKEGAVAAFQGFLALYTLEGEQKYLDAAKHACDVFLSYLNVWDISLPPGRLSDHAFKTRGWTGVSVQNQHLDIYGVLLTPELACLAKALNHPHYGKLPEVMFRSCGQLIDPFGSQGEQIQQTNFAQRGDMTNVQKLRGGYSESWTVFWITAHFLNAAARMTSQAPDKP